MPDKPNAEITIDESLVRRLLDEQGGDLGASALPLSHAAEGWDCSVWRLGPQWAVRLPRRAMAAPFVAREQQALPEIAARLRTTEVIIPAPLLSGVPSEGYPWPWSVVPWIDGTGGLEVSRADRSGWATRLAAALGALHHPAPADFPQNPFRGVPLPARSEAVESRVADLRAAGTLTDGEARDAASVWKKGRDAAPWAHAPVWVHGDLHPGNIVARGGELTGIIDFVDVTGGDPAYDLAIAWLAFDKSGRERFIDATESRYAAADWTRARAWSVSMSLMLLLHSDDEPAYAALGRESLAEAL
jgi:aminoglycoside phosphotransferase (APT) family kinase protein